MLVADVGDHVDTVNVVPEPLGGEVVGGLERGVDAGLGSVERADTAWAIKAGSAELGESGNTQKSGDSEGFHLNEFESFIIIKYQNDFPYIVVDIWHLAQLWTLTLPRFEKTRRLELF